jgi:hypothetical protein
MEPPSQLGILVDVDFANGIAGRFELADGAVHRAAGAAPGGAEIQEYRFANSGNGQNESRQLH